MQCEMNHKSHGGVVGSVSSTMTQRLTLDLLGGLQVQLTPSAAPLNLPTRKAQALVAYLAIPAGRPHWRDELAALLWSSQSEDSARNALRQTLYRIRRTLAAINWRAILAMLKWTHYLSSLVPNLRTLSPGMLH